MASRKTQGAAVLCSSLFAYGLVFTDCITRFSKYYLPKGCLVRTEGIFWFHDIFFTG